MNKIPRKRTIERSQLIKGLKIGILISLLIMTALILVTVNREALHRALASLQPRILAGLILLMFANWLLAGLQFKILIHTLGEEIGLLDSIVIYLIGAFISSVTPFATGGGPFQVYLLHKKGISIGKGSTVILTLFILRIFFFGLASAVFLVFFNWAISPGVIPGYIFYLAFGIGILISAAIILFTLIPGLINRVFSKILQFKPVRGFLHKNFRAKRLLVKARRELEEFRSSLALLGQYKTQLIIAGLCTVGYWSSLFLIIPLVLNGLQLEPHFFKSYVMQTVINLVLPYMPTPGASGIAEIGFASLGVSFIPGNFVGLVTLIWRFFVYYLVLIVGGIMTMKEFTGSEDVSGSPQ
ncbi:MAG: lysylphosphatidylglycerol synthase transmembrane domain-containing protein [Halanaerobium sp.]|nr:lysylphosphatidylglycerol synthase transmembrane domain-containing protein [Halanaerobium sp.]